MNSDDISNSNFKLRVFMLPFWFYTYIIYIMLTVFILNQQNFHYHLFACIYMYTYVYIITLENSININANNTSECGLKVDLQILSLKYVPSWIKYIHILCYKIMKVKFISLLQGNQLDKWFGSFVKVSFYFLYF